MTQCVMCGAEVANPGVTGSVCDDCSASESDAAQGFMAKLGKLPGAALVVSLVPQFASMRSSSSSTVNGVVVESSYIDYVGVGAGSLALVIAALAIVASLREGGPHKNLRLGVCAVALLMGAYGLLGGLGMA